MGCDKACSSNIFVYKVYKTKFVGFAVIKTSSMNPFISRFKPKSVLHKTNQIGPRFAAD